MSSHGRQSQSCALDAVGNTLGFMNCVGLKCWVPWVDLALCPWVFVLLAFKAGFSSIFEFHFTFLFVRFGFVMMRVNCICLNWAEVLGFSG